jgi:hypothetical protein
MRMGEVIYGSRVMKGDEAKAFLVDVSRRMNEREEREAQVRALARRPAKGDAASVRFAMRCIEQRIVRGLWVLEISQEPDGPREARRHGMQYMRDRGDVDWRYEDAPGGKWDAPAPRPALPSSEEIDAAREAQGWIRWLEPEQARFFTLAAMSKRGDRARRVVWDRVIPRLKHLKDVPLRTLQDRYDQALRRIVAEMTVQRLSA